MKRPYLFALAFWVAGCAFALVGKSETTQILAMMHILVGVAIGALTFLDRSLK